MALANMYKKNNVSYYESGAGFSGIFTDTLANLLTNGNLDYSIFLNCGCDWSYLNTGCKGNHFSMYPDWVGGVLAIRQGPSTHDIKYVGSAVMSKTNTSAVFNVTKQLGDNSGFLNSRFLIDVIPGTYGTDSTYNSFNYASYTGQKYGFNSCILQNTSYYRPTDTAHTGTFISDYTTLTGDNAKRLTAGAYQILATNYNPYLADSDTLDSFAIGYLYMFFEIDGELIACRNIPAMPNTAQWQSWFRYTDGGTDVYVTIGKYDNAVTVGSQGALPSSDDVKGIYCYNYNGTCQNCYSTKNAISYIANCYGIRWMVGNTGLSTAGDWRQKVCLGVMASDGIIDHDNWLIGESAIQASDNPNKNTDYDHIPTHGGGGGGNGDELTDMLSRGQFYGSGLTKYYVDVPAAKLQKALGNWDNIATGKDVLQNLLSYKILCFPSTTFSNGMTDPFVIAGVELKDEDNNTITAKRLTSTGAVDLPGITITPTFNDFRDYAPYTKIQMFVPLCGWFDLPPWCMGRRITGEMYINPYSGTVRCLVRADGNVVAELGGNASIDLPFNATAVGMKSAAVISNLIQTAGAVGRAAMLPTVNTLAGAGSAALGTICAMNANYTESKGTMGDGSNVYGLYNVYIKITRPATVDNSGNSLVSIPAQYSHDYGRPCNKQLKLAKGDGYTQIMDANITGAMTDREKQMIIDGFRHGLIL